MDVENIIQSFNCRKITHIEYGRSNLTQLDICYFKNKVNKELLIDLLISNTH